MTGPHKDPRPPYFGRHERPGLEEWKDPYRPRRKLPEPSVCIDCGAVWREGRWQWMARPAEAEETLCPACQRIRDEAPAGFLSLSGSFLDAHREEILNLIENHTKRQSAEHPLKRIMARQETPEGLLITTTDPHLARGLGDAIYDAYDGELEYRYADGDTTLRVRWHRDA